MPGMQSELLEPAVACHGDDLTDLTAIFAPEMQVTCLSRPPQRAIAAYLHAAAQRGVLGSGFRRVVEMSPAAQALPKFGLPDFPGRAALEADIELLCVIYADLLGCPAIGLRLEMTHHAMCPRFHVDNTGIRLLCTYRGPGTEWIDAASARRDLLATDAANDIALLAPGAEVQQAQTFDVVLLKGSLWQGNHRHGAIHRSPSPAATEVPRVLLAIDAMWD